MTGPSFICTVFYFPNISPQVVPCDELRDFKSSFVLFDAYGNVYICRPAITTNRACQLATLFILSLPLLFSLHLFNMNEKKLFSKTKEKFFFFFFLHS